jgi:hypothetical protein
LPSAEPEFGYPDRKSRRSVTEARRDVEPFRSDRKSNRGAACDGDRWPQAARHRLDLIASNLGALSTSAVKGLTSTKLSSLTADQAASFTTAQLSAMSASQRALLASDGSNPYLQEARSLESDGALSYGSMLDILQGAAAGAMTSTKFANLQALAGTLNASGGIATSAYVQQIAQDVVDGNSANAFWNGGSSTATPLGNLSAASSETQVDELIGKWFLGTDLPSTAITSPAIGTTGISAPYQATNLPLFGANGPPIRM